MSEHEPALFPVEELTSDQRRLEALENGGFSTYLARERMGIEAEDEDHPQKRTHASSRSVRRRASYQVVDDEMLDVITPEQFAPPIHEALDSLQRAGDYSKGRLEARKGMSDEILETLKRAADGNELYLRVLRKQYEEQHPGVLPVEDDQIA